MKNRHPDKKREFVMSFWNMDMSKFTPNVNRS